MKYGLYYIKNTHNIGDDIWAYAQSLFYPRIDYLIDNQAVYRFRTENNEVVTSIMGAFIEPWNYEFHFWIPDNFIPFFIGSYFKPSMWDYLSNTSVKNYMKQFEPIGVRSHSNVYKFKELGLDSYFSGCITLTLPRFIKKTGKYICCVDVEEKIIEYIKEKVGDSLDVRIMTHEVWKWKDDEKEKYYNYSIFDKFNLVKEYLEIYANAHCVITSRLHCALPCLTQQTPVLVALPKNGNGVSDMEDRMSSYFDMFHMCYYEDFDEGIVDYNFLDPPDNPNTFILYRDEMIKKINDYIARCENGDIKKEKHEDEIMRLTDYANILTDEIIRLKEEVQLKNKQLYGDESKSR